MSSACSNADEPMVSVIVPVFNAGVYLQASLESLLAQDFRHCYEVILVDDCSNDDSPAICRGFVENHARLFKLVEHASNGGVSMARNTGLEHARGRYVMFFDADDILPQTALSQLQQAAEQYSADIVKGNLLLFDDHGRRAAPDNVPRTALVTGDAVLTTLFKHDQVRGHIGGKLFRRDHFGGLRFAVGVRMAEDLLFFSEMFAVAESLVLLAHDVYFYRKHAQGSTGSKYSSGAYIDWIDAVEQSGKFASSDAQVDAHKSLRLRTLTQIARECRKMAPADAVRVLDIIEQKCEQWGVRLGDLLTGGKLSLAEIGRYVKLRQALRGIRRNLVHS